MSAIPAQVGRAARIIVLPYWLALCVVTHWPGMRMADPSIPYAPLDKFCHAVGYGGLAALLMVIGLRWLSLGRCIAAVVGVLSVYGVLDELTQPWFYRTIDAWDLLANAVGVVGGLSLVYAALRYGRGNPRSLNAGFERHPQKHERFVRHSVVVSVLTFLSRLLGLVRDAVLGAVFGKGVVLDAFFIGFMVPNLFRRLFGEGALTAAFLPRYRRLMDDDPELGKRYALAVVLGVSVVLSVLVLLGELLLLTLWASVDVSRWSLALKLTAIMLPYAPMVCAVAFLGTVLQARGKFAPAALAPIELNLGMIVVAVFAAWWSDHTVTMAIMQAVGVLGCGGVQLLVLWRYLSGTGVLTRFFRGDGVGEQVRATLRTMLPMLLGLGVFQVNTLLDGLIAYGLSSPPGPGSGLGETFILLGYSLEYPLHTGAVTTLTFAQRLYQFPLGVFGIAIATAIFPALSALGRDHQREAFEALVRRGLRLTLFIALPASAGLMMTAEPLTRVIFEHGAFTAEDAGRVAWVLMGYAAGVWAYSMTHVLTRAFYAKDDAATPLKVSLVMVGFNLVLNLTLIWPMGAVGLAVSTASSATLQVIVLSWLLGRHVDRVWDRDAWRGAGKVVLAAVAMSLALAFALWHIDPDVLHWIGAFALTVVMVTIGVAVYATAVMLMRCEEIRWLRRG